MKKYRIRIVDEMQLGGSYIGHLIVYSVLIKERKGAEVQ